MLAVRFVIGVQEARYNRAKRFWRQSVGVKAPLAVATYQMPIRDNVRRFLLPHLVHLPFNVAGDAVSALVKERLNFVIWKTGPHGENLTAWVSNPHLGREWVSPHPSARTASSSATTAAPCLSPTPRFIRSCSVQAELIAACVPTSRAQYPSDRCPCFRPRSRRFRVTSRYCEFAKMAGAATGGWIKGVATPPPEPKVVEGSVVLSLFHTLYML